MFRCNLIGVRRFCRSRRRINVFLTIQMNKAKAKELNSQSQSGSSSGDHEGLEPSSRWTITLRITETEIENILYKQRVSIVRQQPKHITRYPPPRQRKLPENGSTWKSQSCLCYFTLIHLWSLKTKFQNKLKMTFSFCLFLNFLLFLHKKVRIKINYGDTCSLPFI